MPSLIPCPHYISAVVSSLGGANLFMQLNLRLLTALHPLPNLKLSTPIDAHDLLCISALGSTAAGGAVLGLLIRV